MAVVDPAPFEAAMPAGVRDVIAQARCGEGVAAAWLARDESARIGECFRLLANRPNLGAELVGWIAGITMFDDAHQRVAHALNRRSHRDDAIPFAIEAFAAGVGAGVPTIGRHWTGIEMLVGRVDRVPPSLIGVLSIGLCSAHALARGSALRLAHAHGARGAIEAARTRASVGDAKSLDDAIEALRGSPSNTASPDDVALLGRLLDGWRATRDPELEPLLSRIGAEIGRARRPLVAKSKGELETAWLALAAAHDPADVFRLLDGPWPALWKTAVARIDALAEFSPDPRISCGVAEVARKYRSYESDAFHDAAANLLLRAPTRAYAASLNAIDAARAVNAACSLQVSYAMVWRAIENLEPARARPELLAEARARCASANDVSALYAAHAANPSDLAAREVLADALQLSGDPRGEFIALQLAISRGVADGATTRRAARLLAEYGNRWTGPLPGIDPGSVRFERGFLVALCSSAGHGTLSRSLDLLEWATIEDATFTVNCDLAPAVRRMPVLRRLGACEGALERLAASGPHRGVRALHCPRTFIPPAGAFPDLVVLGCGWLQDAGIDDDWDAERFRSIQRAACQLGVRAIVHLGFPCARLAFALQQCSLGPPETRFALGPTHNPGFDQPGWRIRARRGDRMIDVSDAPTRPRDDSPSEAEVFDAIALAGGHAVLYAAIARASRRDDVTIVAGEPIDLADPA